MKVLVVLERSPKHIYLMRLRNKKLRLDIKKLIGKKLYTQAILTTLCRGRFEREVSVKDLRFAGAGLILTEYSASWDATNI